MISPLQLIYRFTENLGLEVTTKMRLQYWTERGNVDFAYSIMDLPTLRLASETPGELLHIISVIDAARMEIGAVTEAMETENVATN